VDLQKAKELLKAGSFTCVICDGDTVHTTSKRGIAPLLEWFDSGELNRGFYAADRAVGKAPACIYALMGAKAVYANLMTDAAVEIFERFGIDCEYALRVPMIRNRTDTDFCPVELAVKDISEPNDVVAATRKKLEDMKK